MNEMNPCPVGADRRWRRSLPIAGLLALALVGSIAVEALAEGVVAQRSGRVEIGRGDPPRWSPLEVGQTVGKEDRVRTGADGRVEIRLSAGTIRVHENSLLRLPPPTGEADRVELDSGHSLFDVLRRAGRRFEVHTPTVVVSVKGTRFGVDARAQQGRVVVYRGLVGVRKAGAEAAIETLVREGFLAAAGPDFPIELDVAPAGDPWSLWEQFDLELDEDLQAPASPSGVGEARRVLQRSTDVDVLRRAAERRPEVAERLKKLSLERRGAAARRAVDPADEAIRAMPAAPALGDDREDDMRTNLTRQRLQESMMDAMQSEQEMQVEEMLGDGGNDGSGSGGYGPPVEDVLEDLGRLNSTFGPGIVPQVAYAIDAIDDYFDELTTPYTEEDVFDQLRDQLIANGMDAVLAGNVVSVLMND